MIKKIRNLAKAIIESNQKLSAIERQNQLIEGLVRENIWGNIFNSAVTGSTWFDNVPLHVGRWAANYSLFYILYRVLNEVRPENILELGLGETTKMIQAYKQFHNKNSRCTVIEQSSEWMEIKLKNEISKEYINIIKAEVEDINIKGFNTLVYRNLVAHLAPIGIKFNVILIDGPWGSDKYSRYNIIELLDMIDEHFVIIIDDIQRSGEQETLSDLKEELEKREYNFNVGYYHGEKSQVIIACKKYDYLTSL